MRRASSWRCSLKLWSKNKKLVDSRTASHQPTIMCIIIIKQQGRVEEGYLLFTIFFLFRKYLFDPSLKWSFTFSLLRDWYSPYGWKEKWKIKRPSESQNNPRGIHYHAIPITRWLVLPLSLSLSLSLSVCVCVSISLSFSLSLCLSLLIGIIAYYYYYSTPVVDRMSVFCCCFVLAPVLYSCGFCYHHHHHHHHYCCSYFNLYCYCYFWFFANCRFLLLCFCCWYKCLSLTLTLVWSPRNECINGKNEFNELNKRTNCVCFCCCFPLF